ncbi:hypothetical protein V502_05590 [Pseudogymnoascus sp. VKM F-4520 (FW-2644)]|nr:hypothetical protein V502_05590 [Pseudogymnoascus sp. VKM F-4520 (FW-2644)]
MAFVKFIIIALAATVFTTSVLGNPVPTADISVNHLEKRVCNEYGCGMKCKGTANTPCSKKLNSFHDCDICSYFLNVFGMRNAWRSSGETWPLWLSARSSVTLDSPNEDVAHAAPLTNGNGVDACVEIWFAGT